MVVHSTVSLTMWRGREVPTFSSMLAQYILSLFANFLVIGRGGGVSCSRGAIGGLVAIGGGVPVAPGGLVVASSAQVVVGYQIINGDSVGAPR